MTATATTTSNPAAIQWLSVQKAARAMNKSRRTIYSWLQEGKLHYRRGMGGLVLINEASLWSDYEGPRTPWVTNRSDDDRRRQNLRPRVRVPKVPPSGVIAVAQLLVALTDQQLVEVAGVVAHLQEVRARVAGTPAEAVAP